MTADVARWEELAQAQSARVAAADPLLDPRAPTRPPPPPEEEVRVLADAREVVLGLARHAAARSVWTAPWVHALALARVDGLADDEVTQAVGEVLDRWEAEVLAPSPAAWEAGTVASVSLPARDDAPVAALVARHFARSVVLAVRRIDPEDAGAVAGDGGGAAVREADADDAGAVLAATVATHRADQAYGFVPALTDLEARLTDDVAKALAGAPGWTWLAEQAGEVVGVCQVEPPARAGWITSAVTASPAAYLGLLHVAPEARGTGVGRRLVAAAHARCEREGVAAVLLHHAAASPRSAPFWAREGYRPLLTTWSRRPAVRAPARPRRAAPPSPAR